MSDMKEKSPEDARLTALRDLRLSEMSPAQREDARELWIRDQIEWVGEASRDHMRFLLRRLDEARRVQLENVKVIDALRATLCGVGVVGEIDEQQVIRRSSVLELIDRARRDIVAFDESAVLQEVWKAVGGDAKVRVTRADVLQAMGPFDAARGDDDFAAPESSASSKAMALIEAASAEPERLREIAEQHMKAGSKGQLVTFSPAYDAMHDAVDAASTQLHQITKMFRDDASFMEAVKLCDDALVLVAEERAQADAANKAVNAEQPPVVSKLRLG